MSESAVKQFLIEIPHAGNEGIHRVVDELSRQAGIARPGLYRSNGKHIMFDMMPAAAMSAGGDKAAIILHKPMLGHMLGRDLNFAGYAAIPDEIKGLLAHEMGHISRGDLRTFGLANMARFTPLAGMAGAMIGLHLIRSHWQKNKDEPLSPQAAEEALKLPDTVKSPTIEAAKKVALYTVAAAAGVTAGVVVGRGMRHHMEYACDAFSKELLGSGEPLARALEKLEAMEDAALKQLLKELPEHEGKRMVKWIDTLKDLLHPPAAERIERLRR